MERAQRTERTFSNIQIMDLEHKKWIGLKHEDGSVELISALDSNICIDLSGGKAVNKS